jgi:membrane-associated phospholipid phosphatase
LANRILNLLILAAVSFGTAPLNAQTPDTLFTKRDLFDASDAVLAAGFVAATAAAAPADRWFTRELQDDARQANRALNRGAAIFRVVGHPGGMIAGGTMYVIGLSAKDRRIEDLGLHSVEAIVLGHVITGATKIIAGRARPFVSKDNARNFKLFRGIGDDNYRSFPSGHATAAFAFASVISAETSHWWPETRWIVGPVMYGAAALTGVSRIYNNQHWASDVLAGAAVGTLTGIKLFRFQHSHPDNWLDRKLLRAGVSVSNNGSLMPILSVARQ